jgi:tetratricopeptide (TPR) repeat protein
LLRDVAMHNRQDVVSLAYLLVELATRLASPAARHNAHPGDVIALGRTFVRHGRLQDGLECYETALGRFTVSSGESYELAQLVADRARVLARLGRRHEAAGAWLDLALGRGYLAAAAWIEIAKYREHVAKDLEGALRAANEAAALAARSRLRGMRLLAVEHDLPRRMVRLRRRISRRAPLREAA